MTEAEKEYRSGSRVVLVIWLVMATVLLLVLVAAPKAKATRAAYRSACEAVGGRLLEFKHSKVCFDSAVVFWVEGEGPR